MGGLVTPHHHFVTNMFPLMKAGQMQWCRTLAASAENVFRLEVLVAHIENMETLGLVDTQDDIAVAQRKYNFMMGPFRCESKEVVEEKTDREWCGRS